MAEGEQFLDLTFPTKGVDRSQEWGQQPPGTTPVGENVRAYEPATERNRGGSRAGMARYIDQAAGGDNPIQNISFIVHQDSDATLAAWEHAWWKSVFEGTSRPPITPGNPPPPIGEPLLDPTTEDDGAGGPPRRVGDRYIRQGGSGVTPNRNIPNDGSTRGWRYIQSTQSHVSSISSGTPATVAFGSPVTRHNMLVVCVALSDNEALAVPLTLTDTLGNTYTKAADTGYHDPHGASGLGGQSQIFWCRTENGGANTVSVAFSADTNAAWIAILEYGGLEITTPFQDAQTATGVKAADTENHATGSINTGGTDRLVIGFFNYSRFSGATATLESEYTLRETFESGVVPSHSFVFDDLSSLGSSVNPTVEHTLAGEAGQAFHTAWRAAGAAWRWGL